MFGLTQREQRWKAEQKAAETLAAFAAVAVKAKADIAVAEAKVDADELARLRVENAELRLLLTRYRLETPLGHQPHMLANKVDEALGNMPNAATGSPR